MRWKRLCGSSVVRTESISNMISPECGDQVLIWKSLKTAIDIRISTVLKLIIELSNI